MTLPVLATVLLILATVYAAIVSFRHKSDEKSSVWIFPRRAKRSARKIVGFASLALTLALVVWLGMSARNSTRPSSRFLIPEGYTGWVRIEFEVQGTPPLPVESGRNVLQIPHSGRLKTSSTEQYGWANDFYEFYSSAGLRPIPDTGPPALIWGKINGEATTSSGKRKYREFFVGTQQQFKESAGEKILDPSGALQ